MRIGPRSNRWKDLLEYEERLVEIEQRRAGLLEEIGALNLQIREEPERHTSALAAWMAAGEKDERPASRLPELEHALADRQASTTRWASATTRRSSSAPNTSRRTERGSSVTSRS